jgi:hypothetical protein
MRPRTSRSYALVGALVLTAVTAFACSSSEDPAGGAEGAAPAATPPEGTPTYTKDIEPLLQKRCQSCHHEGGIAPFTLVAYEEIKGLGPIARKRIEDRTMPPWGAFDSDACKMQHPFKDDLRLSQDEIALFGRWVDAGMPQGDASVKNPAPSFAPDVLATKTATLQMRAPYEVVGGGPDDYRCFPLDPGFTTDTWVRAMNVVPGNNQIVHHVLVYTDATGEGASKADASGSYPCFGGPGTDQPSLLMAWAPGVRPTRFDDAAIKVKAGSKLVMQVHYHPTATSQKDLTGFELEVQNDKPNYVAMLQLIGNAGSKRSPLTLLPGPDDPPTGPEFFIPANAKGHTESMDFVMPDKLGGLPVPMLSIASVGAHMHLAGVDMRIEIERAAGHAGPANECLLGTPKYDFNWQRGYVLDKPVDALPTVGPGDRLRFTCTYDNTMANPNVAKAIATERLPGPIDIRLGESTLDEMCLGVLALVRPITIVD